MPRRKRPASFEVTQVPSPSGVEVISVDIVSGKAVKKRTFEKVLFEVPAPNDRSPLDDYDTASTATAAALPKGPRRSASVCLYLLYSPPLTNNLCYRKK